MIARLPVHDHARPAERRPSFDVLYCFLKMTQFGI